MPQAVSKKKGERKHKNLLFRLKLCFLSYWSGDFCFELSERTIGFAVFSLPPFIFPLLGPSIPTATVPLQVLIILHTAPCQSPDWSSWAICTGPPEWHLYKTDKQKHQQNKPSWDFGTPILKKISIVPHRSNNSKPWQGSWDHLGFLDFSSSLSAIFWPRGFKYHLRAYDFPV